MHILLSNDDGILAPGLAALRRELMALGDVSVVAPESVQSAVAHGITVRGPVAAQEVHVQDTFFGYSVDGRPADCVKLAVCELLDTPPNLVVSGINDGANVSINVLYSGTVAAAAEGALLGFPAIAVSLEQGIDRDFNRAARLVLPIIKQLLDNGLSAGQLININIPDLTARSPCGVRVVPMATRVMLDQFVRHAAPDGRDYYWLTPDKFQHGGGDVENDLDAVLEGYISITPLHFDLTQYDQLRNWSRVNWDIEP